MSSNNKSLLFLVGLIPIMQAMLMTGVFIRAIVEESLFMVFIFFLIVYIWPPLMWRFLSPFIPAQMGSSYLGVHTETVNGWFVSYQIQRIYNALPFLESVLKLVPGLYSSWLRLWGARIGAKVNWTSQSKVIDRPFIHIGDRCLIGNAAYLSAHSIKKKDDRYLLYLKEISIGSDVVLSLQSIVGPGVTIGNRAFVMARTAILPNTTISEGQIYQ